MASAYSPHWYALKEGPEGVKFQLGLACFCPGKMELSP